MNVNDESEANARQWYVVRCRAQKEEHAATALEENLELATFLPQANVRFGDGTRRVPLFPGYIFAQADGDEVQRIGLEAAPGVMHVLKCDGRPQPVPDEVISDIRERLQTFNAQGFLPYHRFLPGDRVRVGKGPFRGVEAIFAGPRTPSARVKLLLQLLGRTNEVQVDVDCLEPAAGGLEARRPRGTRGRGRHIRQPVSTW